VRRGRLYRNGSVGCSYVSQSGASEREKPTLRRVQLTQDQLGRALRLPVLFRRLSGLPASAGSTAPPWVLVEVDGPALPFSAAGLMAASKGEAELEATGEICRSSIRMGDDVESNERREAKGT
jgi:hypothetical protein